MRFMGEWLTERGWLHPASYHDRRVKPKGTPKPDLAQSVSQAALGKPILTFVIMSEATAPNSRAAIFERRAAGVLTWSGPALMLFARSAFAVAAQGLVAAIYASHGSATPWRDAGAWLPVYGTLIDAGCLSLLWWFARREGITLLDLIGFQRKRWGAISCLALR